MKKRINYERKVNAAGGRKYVNQKGLHLDNEVKNYIMGPSTWVDPDVVRIQSINDRGGEITSHLYLEIPRENIQELINNLIEFL